jgi:uncharacterized delta-60 repeat protein
MHRFVISSFLGAAALVFATEATAAPGDLDATFGVGGVVQTDVGYFDSPSDLAIQPDGKIVAVGTVDYENGNRSIFVARYLENGSPDGGFGIGGKVVPIRYHQVGPALALQSDGRIVLATRGETDGGPVFLYRFNVDGTSDGTFGTAGTAVLSPPQGVGIAGVVGVAIVSGGKIVVGLRGDPVSGGATVAFARFNADGTPDAAFGAGGFVNVSHDVLWLPLGFALQPDGRMLVAGTVWQPGRVVLDAFVARFNADGTLDASFDADGIAIVQRPSNGTEFQSVALASDGSILAGGREFGSIYNENDWLLAKFTSEGILDPAFGAAGSTVYDPGSGDDALLDLSVTPAGIFATGLIQNGSLGLPLALFRENGLLDSDFGAGGFAGLPGQFTFGAWRLAVQADGKVIVLGVVQSFVPTFNQDLYLARYEGSECLSTKVSFDLSPRTLNLLSKGRWMTGTLEPAPPASPVDIDVGSILLNGTVPVDRSAPVSIGDVDGDGVPDLTVKFGRADVKQSVEEGDAVTVTVTGKIGSGCFAASDVIRVTRGHVSAPPAGSVLQGGSTSVMRWDTAGVHTGSVAIFSSIDDGATWSLVARELPNNGNFLWAVPNTPTDQARIALLPVGSSSDGNHGVDDVLAVSDRFVISSVLDVGAGSFAFALHGAIPNPSRGLSVSFSLANAEPATLTVFDVSGREVSRRQVGVLGVGQHMVSFGKPGTLAPGLYIVHLIQGSRRLTTRAVVTQ